MAIAVLPMHQHLCTLFCLFHPHDFLWLVVLDLLQLAQVLMVVVRLLKGRYLVVHVTLALVTGPVFDSHTDLETF